MFHANDFRVEIFVSTIPNKLEGVHKNPYFLFFPLPIPSAEMSRFLCAIPFLLQLVLFSAANNALSNDCPPSMCGHLEIIFPYNLETAPKICKTAGFSANLSCSSTNDTILTLPSSESYKVTAFNYDRGFVTVQVSTSYNRSCPWLTGFPKRPNATGSVFYNVSAIDFVILNCTKKMSWRADDTMVAGPISCLGNLGSFVYAMDEEEGIEMLPPYCTIKTSGELFQANGLFSVQDYAEETMDGGAVTVDLYAREYDGVTGLCSSCASDHKFCGYNSEMGQSFCFRRSNRGLHRLVKGIVIGAVLLIFFIAVLVVLYFIRKYSNEREKRIKLERFLANYKSTTLTRYSYADIKKITEKFKHKLGQGGFGIVFKGELKNGIPVAVKMLEASRSNGDDFVNEVSTIGKIHHVNVVRLLGFCSEGTNRALVYEFMPNESLEKFIFLDESNKKIELFSTEKLQEIAIGIALGIDYLHQGCNQRILHFDIKPHNILLDHDFNPKVSDFGLAKLCSRDQSIVTISAARGTMGYIAPEVYSRNFGPVSHKSDVYSYGMLLLEMVGRRKNVDPTIENVSEVYYPEWIYNKLLQRNNHERAMEMDYNEEILKKLAIIALWCIQWNPSERPSMTKVVQMLMGNLQSLEMPPTPFVSSSGQHENSNLACIREEVAEV